MPVTGVLLIRFLLRMREPVTTTLSRLTASSLFAEPASASCARTNCGVDATSAMATARDSRRVRYGLVFMVCRVPGLWGIAVGQGGCGGGSWGHVAEPCGCVV